MQDTHEMIHFTCGSQSLNSSNGQVCYVRKSLLISTTTSAISTSPFQFVAHNANNDSQYVPSEHGELKKLVEFSLFLYTYSSDKRVYILSVYKHNRCNDRRALEEMYEFLQTNIPRNSGACLLVLGDFNIDFNKEEEREKYEYLQTRLGLRALFEHEKTFQYKTHIDWAFKSRQFKFGVESQVYDTWFSDHSAIWTEIDFEKE